ncbi:MAG: twin-arginine translocase TatA/TatE family subunit [Peptococcaceae bacterium]|nr:twin-arginine translocase TatA/TatE family subunit [Peptococcaceae bacterium]
MFGLSMGEIVVILLVIVLLFGSTKLAGLGKSAGKSIREFKEEIHKDDEPAAKKEDAEDVADTAEKEKTDE